MAKLSRAAANGRKAFRTVKQVLTAIGWEPEETDFEGVLRVDFSEDNIPISEAVAEVRMEYERFLFYLNFGRRAPSKNRAEVMEFITRANYELVIGNFEMNLHDGLVRFKSSIDFTNSELTSSLVRSAITSAMDVVETYGDAFVEVIKGKKTSEEALAEAEEGIATDDEAEPDA